MLLPLLPLLLLLLLLLLMLLMLLMLLTVSRAPSVVFYAKKHIPSKRYQSLHPAKGYSERK